jgi:hypothetical protein
MTNFGRLERFFFVPRRKLADPYTSREMYVKLTTDEHCGCHQDRSRLADIVLSFQGQHVFLLSDCVAKLLMKLCDCLWP